MTFFIFMHSVCEVSKPCENEGTCALDENNESGYTCTCARGYTGSNCQRKLKKAREAHVKLRINFFLKSLAVIQLEKILFWHLEMFIFRRANYGTFQMKFHATKRTLVVMEEPVVELCWTIIVPVLMAIQVLIAKVGDMFLLFFIL